jgi:hypothetical protein
MVRPGVYKDWIYTVVKRFWMVVGVKAGSDPGDSVKKMLRLLEVGDF